MTNPQRELLQGLLNEVLVEIERRPGFYGAIAIEATVEDGRIQIARRRVEETVRMPSRHKPPVTSPR